MAEQHTCPRCGHPVDPNDQFCDFCGLPLQNNLDELASSSAESSADSYRTTAFPPRKISRRQQEELKKTDEKIEQDEQRVKDQAEKQRQQKIEQAHQAQIANEKKKHRAKQKAHQEQLDEQTRRDHQHAQNEARVEAAKAKQRAREQARKQEIAEQNARLHSQKTARQQRIDRHNEQHQQQKQARKQQAQAKRAKLKQRQAAQAKRAAQLKVQKHHQPVRTDNHPQHHYKLAGVLIGALVVVVVGGYGVGANYFSKASTLNRIIDHPTNVENSVSQSGHTLTKPQREALKACLSDPEIVQDLHKKSAVSNDIHYRKTGHHFSIFDRYQLVVNTQAKKRATPTIKKTRSPKKPVRSHSLTERQAAQKTITGLWQGMNNWTQNGATRQNIGSYFVDGQQNNSYKYFAIMAKTYYQNRYSVTYQAHFKSLHGHQQPLAHFDLTYRFYSGNTIHVQKFHWKALLLKHQKGYLIQWAIGDDKPFSDKVENKE